MPLIKPKIDDSLVDLKVKISKPVLDEIQAYCDQFGIKRIDDFIEQSAEISFKKCSEWKKLRKSIAKSKLNAK